MRYCLFVAALSICFVAEPRRDPFSYVPGYYSLCCVSIGSLNHEFFARVYDNGLFSTLRLHERYGEFEVVALSVESITLKDTSGRSHLLILASERCTKKSPSTYES